MSFSAIIAEAALDMHSMTGEPCAVHGASVWSETSSGEPIFVTIEQGLVDRAGSTYTAMRIAKASVPELREPCEKLRVVCNAADDSRGTDFQGGAFAGQAFVVENIDTEYGQTWILRVTEDC